MNTTVRFARVTDTGFLEPLSPILPLPIFKQIRDFSMIHKLFFLGKNMGKTLLKKKPPRQSLRQKRPQPQAAQRAFRTHTGVLQQRPFAEWAVRDKGAEMNLKQLRMSAGAVEGNGMSFIIRFVKIGSSMN